MIYGYIRVSSDKQTVENQRYEINKFCENNQLKIDDWIEETISGTKNYTKRQLGNLLKKVHKDDIIICSEVFLTHKCESCSLTAYFSCFKIDNITGINKNRVICIVFQCQNRRIVAYFINIITVRNIKAVISYSKRICSKGYAAG